MLSNVSQLKTAKKFPTDQACSFSQHMTHTFTFCTIPLLWMMFNIFDAACDFEPVAVCPRKASHRVGWVSFWKHTQRSRACLFLASFQSSDMLCRRSVLPPPTFSKQHQGKSDGMATTDLQRSWYSCESPKFKNYDLMAYDAVCNRRIKPLD